MEAGGCAAGRAGAGNCGEINPGLTKDNPGKFFQCRLEQANGGGVSPFLWPEHGCRPLRPNQRVADITQNDQLCPRQPGIQTGKVDRAQVGELRGQVAQQLTIIVSKPGAQRLKDAGAAVDSCGTTHSDEDAPGPVVEGGTDEVTGAGGRSMDRVAVGGLEETKAGSIGHFDDGGRRSDQPEIGFYRVTEWVAGFGGDASAMQVLDKEVAGSVTAVADGKGLAARVQAAAGKAPRDGLSRPISREAVLECIWGDQDVHDFNDA